MFTPRSLRIALLLQRMPSDVVPPSVPVMARPRISTVPPVTITISSGVRSSVAPGPRMMTSLLIISVVGSRYDDASGSICMYLRVASTSVIALLGVPHFAASVHGASSGALRCTYTMLALGMHVPASHQPLSHSLSAAHARHE